MNTTSTVKPWEPQQRLGSLKTWLDKHQELMKQSADHQKNIRVVFIGGSLTKYFLYAGQHIWDKYYEPEGAYNYGICGDNTSNILWRIQNHELAGLQPKLIVFQCGYNNIFADKSNTVAEDTAKGIETILQELRARCPDSKIIHMGVMIPIRDPGLDHQCLQLDEMTEKFDNQNNIYFLKTRAHYLDSNGMVEASLRTSDGVHLTRAGYQPWEAEAGNWWPNWMQIHNQLTANSRDQADHIKALFLGVSLTNFWGGDGRQLWDSYYAPKGSANYGIPGDSTSNVLWRIQNKEMDGLRPKVIVFSCGAGYNSLHNPDPKVDPRTQPSGPEVLRGLKEIITELKAKFTDTGIIVIGHTPYHNDDRRPDVSEVSKEINRELKKFADEKTVYFLDLTPSLVDSSGQQLPGLFKDGLHFTLDGYRVWHRVMGPLFERLML
ncbi:unnamed protein product [Medioppia subpectinata]|uniref:SGNH hydrolase-type esterase domain-containing protein n=1 Tax=Medioppia subpectinata TaxID=1979941 RepID=A0A7R9PXU8_9ACAR|nr:unnamed protein product [Medioppia subpectinata]CAG2105420.1 unnamed protein product [Medioppia subpectinata]